MDIILVGYFDVCDISKLGIGNNKSIVMTAFLFGEKNVHFKLMSWCQIFIL